MIHNPPGKMPHDDALRGGGTRSSGEGSSESVAIFFAIAEAVVSACCEIALLRADDALGGAALLPEAGHGLSMASMLPL